MKTVVITGSTKGIGYGLAEEFLKRECQVVVSGRKQADAEAAAGQLAQIFGDANILAQACDVGQYAQVQALWSAVVDHFGQVDIWVSNAGQGHALENFWELPAELIESVVQANLLGQMYNAKVVLTAMIEQGSGAFYMMEGKGSDGKVLEGLTLYSATKRGGNYLFDALVKEAAGLPVIVGSLSPGMVVTDLLSQQRSADPENWERTKKVFNILADKVETVTPWLVEKMLANQQHGAAFRWLTGGKVMWRFLMASFNKRDLFAEEG